MVQLPALNTPQFTWGRVKMPKQPQPVPPIFQPEVAARAIVWAAHHPQRQLMVGWPTIKAILGNAVAPAAADLYLARTGYQAQQTDEPVPADRPDNLFEPVPGAQAAHGPFDNRARRQSIQLWGRTHPLVVSGLATAGALAVATRSLTRRWRVRPRADG
jgi:hypothetical protein